MLRLHGDFRRIRNIWDRKPVPYSESCNRCTSFQCYRRGGCPQPPGRKCCVYTEISANSQPVRGRPMVAPTFTESASENVGAVINCPRRKCCVYTEISGEFATCTRAISDRPYILRMAPSVNVGAAISRPRRKCCDYTEIPGEFATCSRAISDRPYILRIGFGECRGGY